MNLDQADKILDYGTVPQNRAEQLRLIQIVGYTKVNGVDSLSECPNYQLRQVAQRLFKEAEKKIYQYWNAIEEEERSEQDNKFPEYHAFLCEITNIPPEDHNQYTISKLEEQLQQ